MKCIVCKKESEYYTIMLEVSSTHPPKDETETLVDVCPECGFMKLRGAETSFMKKLSTGYTKPDISKVNINALLEEVELPNRWNNEKLVWVEPTFSGKEGNIRNVQYEKEFKGKLPSGEEGKYWRLVHFLLMNKKERQAAFGNLKCSAVSVTNDGYVRFQEGYHRFYLFRYLGVKRIPVGMTQESIDNAKEHGIKIYNSRS